MINVFQKRADIHKMVAAHAALLDENKRLRKLAEAHAALLDENNRLHTEYERSSYDYKIMLRAQTNDM